MNQRKDEHIIYHFVNPTRWHDMKNKSSYFPVLFEKEGFIHCCFEDQKAHVIKNYFSDKPYLILALDRTLVEEYLKIEATVGIEAFPHIYSEIEKSWIIQIEHKA